MFLYEEIGSLEVSKMFEQLRINPNGFRFPSKYAELNKKFGLSNFQKVHHYEKKNNVKICSECGSEFETAHLNHKRCSACVLEARKERLRPKKCLWCHEPMIKTSIQRQPRNKHGFCSMPCQTYFYSVQSYVQRRYEGDLEKELLNFLEKNCSLILSAFKPEKEESK